MANNLTVIVLAAGGGTRMKSKTMKVLHPLCGRSMIGHVLVAVQAVRARSDRRRGRPPARAGLGAHRLPGARRRPRGPGDPGRDRPRRPGGDGVGRLDDRHRHRRVRRHPAARGREPARLRRGARGRAARRQHPVRGGRDALRLRPRRAQRRGRRRGDRRGEGRDRRATRDPGDQLGDPRVRRRVPGRGAAPALERQREGRVLPHRDRADRPRRRDSPSGRTSSTT